MKRGILITLVSAIIGGLTAYAVVMNMTSETVQFSESPVSGAQFRILVIDEDRHDEHFPAGVQRT